LFILLTGDSGAGSALPGRFPSHAEADFVWWGLTTAEMRLTPRDDLARSPALITRAARLLADFPTLVVRCGTGSAPKCPYMETGAQAGEDPTKGPSVQDAGLLWDSGFSLGRLLGGLGDRLVLGMSCPGCEVTARLILKALGYKAGALDDSPSREGEPSPWEKASSRLEIRPGDLIGHGFKAVSELGDPALVIAAAMTAGAMGGAEVLLSGGLQMLAASALLRDLGEKGRIGLATTGRTEKNLAGALGELSALLYLRVQVVDLGEVSDGAGASGAALLAEESGFAPERVLDRALRLSEEIESGTPGSREGGR
jgi:NaMN:DMB phosphoribosyltransferase